MTYLAEGNSGNCCGAAGNQRSMRFYKHIPAAPLSDFIHDFWLYEDYTPSSHANERILPSGTIEMVINLHEHQLRIYDAGIR